MTKRRQRNAFRASVEQRDAELTLQQLDAFAQGWLGNPQHFGRSTKVRMFNQCQKLT
jgi:hypothetical protein